MPRGADIDWRLPQIRMQVAMDADDFGEILGNLLDNARKWARTTVVIDAAEIGGGRISLCVADDGPGIPSGVSSSVLDRGSTDAGNDHHRAAESSGLGLAIVRDLASAYGVDVALDNGPLGGARVTLTLSGSKLP